MAKANMKLPDGTSVELNGSPEEIARIMNLYGSPVKADPKASTSVK
ncbi:MAG: hypothetical protein M1347_02905 [Chloroflexi bacterium]|nr:hypothetical protein [Chloroflexota bacterium]